jgi:hypothetical protein
VVDHPFSHLLVRFVSNINLVHAVSLRVLDLEQWVCSPIEFLSQAPTLLSQIASSSIESMKFGIKVNSVDELETREWAALAKTLTKPTFSNLRDIELRIYGDVERMAAMDVIKAQLPERVGMLQVC